MNTNLFTVALAVLAVTADGTAALSGTAQQGSADATANDAAVEATYTNGTVTVTVRNTGAPVEDATVEFGDEEYETDANGTVTADISIEDELDIEVETDKLEAEQQYRLQNGELTLLEEEYNYLDEADDEDEHPEKEQPEAEDEQPEEEGDSEEEKLGDENEEKADDD